MIQVQLVRPDPWENLDPLDHREYQETPADLVRVARRDLRDLLALKEDLAYPDPLDYLDFLEREDFLAFLECLG